VVNYQENVGIAFAMVTAAGLSTTFGAALVFCNRFVTRTNHAILGAALGFSSGVMLYVSFVEILQKAYSSFSTCDCLWQSQTADNAAYTASTLCFFGGVVVVFVLDCLVHAVSRHGHGHSHGPEALSDRQSHSNNNGHHGHAHDQHQHQHSHATVGRTVLSEREGDDVLLKVGPAASRLPAADEFAIEDDSSGDEDHNSAAKDPTQFLDLTLSRGFVESERQNIHEDEGMYDFEKQMARRMQEAGDDTAVSSGERKKSTLKATDVADEQIYGIHADTKPEQSCARDRIHSDSHRPLTKLEDEEAKKLAHMGLMTALAIGIHNFPEGLATFVAALANPQVGAALAVAIAIHNIPEGLCVSIPIYYATGSRWKGFWVAFFSGITEIIGAALGYGFLMAIMGPAAYAVLFGIVAGMMVTIVVKELLPTAHRYDPQDKVVTVSIFVGMVVMALSLVLFRI
jgi:ZIP family zinc transporter